MPKKLVENTLPRPKKGVCHLQDLAKTSVTVNVDRLGRFSSNLSYELGVQAYLRTGLRNHFPPSPERFIALNETCVSQLDATQDQDADNFVN